METKAPFNPGRGDWRRRAEAAEHTVDVLVHKVRQMYQGGVDNLIHKQLESQRRRRELTELRATELERYNTQLEREVAERTRAMHTILDNVQAGFLVVGPNFRVQEGYTRSCETLVGRPVAVGAKLAEILGVVDAGKATELELALGQVFDDWMDEEVALDQIPSRFETEGRVLRVAARAVRDDQHSVVSLLLTITDISELEEAQRESLHHEVLLRILKQKPAFIQFVQDTRDSIEAARDAVQDQVFVRRMVHTLKGNAASYWLDDVVKATHQAESQSILDLESLSRLDEAMRAFLEANDGILGVNYDHKNGRVFEVGSEQLRALREIVDAQGKPFDARLKQWIIEVVKCPAEEILGPTASFVMKLAQRLDKEVDFDLRGASILVDAERMSPVFGVLSHLLQNAVYHGLEEAWERGEKSARGRVSVDLSADENAYYVSVVDDGRGVNFDALTQRAFELGLICDEQNRTLSWDEKLSLIFAPGLSSLKVVTDISGRGVGMSSVKAVVEALDGTISIETQPSIGTQILLRIPR